MKRHLPALAFLAFAAAHAQTLRRPKLVLVIVVDQFRYDYTTRFNASYNGGLATLLDKGAVFSDARYPQIPTFTAVGHSLLLSGAPPSMSGIVGNSWYAREEHRIVTSVCDDAANVVGAIRAAAPPAASPNCTDSSPASPRRMLVDTLGDELKIANPASKVIGVSLKARSAILPAGHMADGAYWFDESGVFVSSSFYGPALPAWASDFDKTAPADAYAGKEWMGQTFASGANLYRQIPASPWGNELTEAFAESAIDGEQLGKRGATDLLTVSFSSNDYVGHRFGPDDPHVQDMAVRTDHLLDRLFHFIEARGIGMTNTVVVLTADHGVSPVPETNLARRMPGGREPAGQINQVAQDALIAHFGPGEWLPAKSLEDVVYLNQELILQKKLDPAEVDRVVAEALAGVPHVFRVYTREQLTAGAGEDPIGRALTVGFFPRRAANVFVLFDPYWLPGTSGATHGTPFSYDNHVPLIFMGPGIRSGRYRERVSITDVAPTLADMLNLETPSGSVGRVLYQMIGDNR